MSSPNKDKNALEVLADTASDDELRNRYDASKQARSYSENENRDHCSTSSDTKEGDDLGSRVSDASSNMTGSRKAVAKTKKEGLRKGKWMEEEEEYTTRVIHHFSSGLITLPEGKTLRTFLADKLQCDPMRITKKFAGASCLSKKIHTLCERPQFTPQEIEAARVEIERLEERFKLRLEHGPGVVLPPMERKTPVPNGSVTSPHYSHSVIPEASSVCSAPASVNPSQMMAPNTQASLALLAYNAQLAAASNPAAALPFGAAPHSIPAIRQSAPAAPPVPAAFANLGTAAPAPTFDLQALLQQNNRVQPANPPPETHPTLNNQQLTQSLVSQLLTQLQTLATVSPAAINQLHSQLFAAVSPPAPPPPTQSPAAGMDIAALLQNVQTTSQVAQAGNFAVPNNGKQHFQIPQAVTNPTNPARGQSNGSSQSASSQYSTRHLVPQAHAQNPSNGTKPPNDTVADLLAQLKKGHDDALQKARRESKKRKKGKFKIHSSSSLTNESSESENQKQLRYERATVVSSESGSRSKNPNDTEGSASSGDLDAARGCDSSSSNSGSDDDRGPRKGPLRKRFKGSVDNGGMTHRALQDHDERMARNAN